MKAILLSFLNRIKQYIIWVLRLKHNVFKEYYFLLKDARLVTLAVWLVGFLDQVTRYRLDGKYLMYRLFYEVLDLF